MSIVTITGGAGNLGRQVARLLVVRGYHVRLFDLPGIDYDFAVGQPGLEVMTGDLRDHTALSHACAGAEWVIHLAAIMPPVSETNQNLAQTVNIDGTRALLATMPVEAKLVLASSVATYGIAQREIVGLDHPQHPIDFYGQTKVQNEHDVLASGRPAALLRISGISVPGLLEILESLVFYPRSKDRVYPPARCSLGGGQLCGECCGVRPCLANRRWKRLAYDRSGLF